MMPVRNEEYEGMCDEVNRSVLGEVHMNTLFDSLWLRFFPLGLKREAKYYYVLPYIPISVLTENVETRLLDLEN